MSARRCVFELYRLLSWIDRASFPERNPPPAAQELPKRLLALEESALAAEAQNIELAGDLLRISAPGVEYFGRPAYSAHDAAESLAWIVSGRLREALGIDCVVRIPTGGVKAPPPQGPFTEAQVEAAKKALEFLRRDELDRLRIEIDKERARLRGKAEADGREAEATEGGQSFSSAGDLASKHNLPAEALRKKLERWRKQNGEGWIEVSSSERRPNEATFLYRPDAVAEVLDSMRDK